MTTNPYIESAPPAVDCAKLIADGARALYKGDKERACRKVWSAVEGRLRAISKRRGWECDGGPRLYEIVNRLEEEIGEEDFRLFFIVSQHMDKNPFIDSIPVFAIEHDIGRAKEFLAMLERAE